jgi:hypothetical protein
VFDLLGGPRAFVRYWRWYSELFSDMASEQFAVDVSSDGGESWVPLERTQNPDLQWRGIDLPLEGTIRLSDRVTFRIRTCESGQFTFSLDPIRPNPQGTAPTVITFTLASPGPARLEIYDVGGRLVRRLIDGVRPAGQQSVLWDGRDDRGTRTAG